MGIHFLYPHEIPIEYPDSMTLDPWSIPPWGYSWQQRVRARSILAEAEGGCRTFEHKLWKISIFTLW